MIRLNKLTDYAVVVLAQLSQDEKRTVTAPQLAQSSGVPVPTVAKLLKALARAGIIASRRGAAGGYAMARDAHAISVADIIRALEGPIALTACVDGESGGCDVETLCPMRGNWDKVNQAIRRALEDVSLADMAAVPLAWPRVHAPAARRADAPPPAQ
jgi:FeS assembly SUF system regulator